jgi:hypothetical protein
MLYKININSIYNSEKLLFSIPIHENQDIINNQIENIFNYNPNSKIILHVNKSFKKFNNNLTKYNNLFINPINYQYTYAKGLLFIHISNFLYALEQNIDFKYFIILSSNEMFIKNGLIQYIEEFKNGTQMIPFNKDNKWHNFHKNIEKEPNIINLLKDINLDIFYGGQTEGQFYEKYIFKKISDIYLKHFGNKEINNFETEEIITQTIFKSFNLNYGLPITLQNYSNKIVFEEIVIDNIINNKIIIPDYTIKTNLISPHINNDCKSIFSIKRIDRTLNNIRNYLTRDGFILNKDLYMLNTYYYSHNSSLILYSKNHLYFKKKNINNYHWFGYEIEKGYYNLTFEIKSFAKIVDFQNIGLKIHYPKEITYNFFFNNLDINVWKNVSLSLHITKKQYVIFIFDNYVNNIDIEIKNIMFNNISKNDKENIGIILYENINSNNNYNINYNNINSMIIEPFLKMYNIFTFISIFNNEILNNQVINNYKPNSILFLDSKDNINDIFIKSTNNMNDLKDECNIEFKFLIYLRLDSIFKKNITDFNFYVNKLNFISYHIPYINNQISNSYDFMSIPYKYINNLYKLLIDNRNDINICYSIYSKLKNNIDAINFIYDDNYSNDTRTPLIKYLSDINDVNKNNGYLFNKKYLNNIYYTNSFSKFLKTDNNEYYFYKKYTMKEEYYQWIGLYIDYFDKNLKNNMINITVNFDIKLLKNINNNLYKNFGLKIHEPLAFYNDWTNKCKLNTYINIELNIEINKVNQYVILNFDNYFEEVEFYIKNFKIILNYQ